MFYPIYKDVNELFSIFIFCKYFSQCLTVNSCSIGVKYYPKSQGFLSFNMVGILKLEKNHTAFNWLVSMQDQLFR